MKYLYLENITTLLILQRMKYNPFCPAVLSSLPDVHVKMLSRQLDRSPGFRKEEEWRYKFWGVNHHRDNI